MYRTPALTLLRALLSYYRNTESTLASTTKYSGVLLLFSKV